MRYSVKHEENTVNSCTMEKNPTDKYNTEKECRHPNNNHHKYLQDDK